MESLIQYAKKPSPLSTKPTDLQKIGFYKYIFTISTLFVNVFHKKKCAQNEGNVLHSTLYIRQVCQ